jgi:hypothetical protein
MQIAPPEVLHTHNDFSRQRIIRTTTILTPLHYRVGNRQSHHSIIGKITWMTRFTLRPQQSKSLALAIVPLKPRPHNIADNHTNHFKSHPFSLASKKNFSALSFSPRL